MARRMAWKVVMIADATDADFTPMASVLGLLSEAGALPELWSDGSEGLRRLAAEVADLVVVDLDTPSLCGLDAMRQIARVASRVPVILLGRKAGFERRMWALESGAVGMVTKPVDGRTLFRYIDKLLKTI
jgi:two-component system, OmpR family, response regulator MtrA